MLNELIAETADPEQSEALFVLAFRPGNPIDVLLIDRAGTWVLPSGPRPKKDGLHASAARRASQSVGVSGRIFKRGLRLPNQSPPITVFPLLVQSEQAARPGEDMTARWFPLGEASDLVDDTLRQAFHVLAKRVAASDAPRRGPAPGRVRSGRA